MSQQGPGTVYANYSEFWRHYVAQHQNPWNRILHVIGTCGGLLLLTLAATVSWKCVLLAVPAAYGAAWTGHFLFERNRPLTLTYPLWSLIADCQMVGLLLTGQSLSSRDRVDQSTPRSRRAA